MQKAVQVARFGQERLKETYARYERFVPALAFTAGMLFDILTIGRIDQAANLVQLAVYLVIVAVFLGIEVLELERTLNIPARLASVWKYRDEVTHFFLGSLLSAFTIFYFKSSSFVGSFVFFVIIIGCLVGNESPLLRDLGVSIRAVLFSVCATSFFFCVLPMAWGRVGFLPFMSALLASATLAGGMAYLLMRKMTNKQLLLRRVLYPYLGMLLTFLVLYLFRVIPPVPLAVKHVGIYRSVERITGGYRVKHGRPFWKFWEAGEQTFRARVGDKIFCFFSVFSPGGFTDSIRVRWMYDDPKEGWQRRDAVPVSISGGRDEGYRGFSFKANYQPGDWQIRIETSDELEIGRIYLTIEKDEETSEQEIVEEVM